MIAPAFAALVAGWLALAFGDSPWPYATPRVELFRQVGRRAIVEGRANPPRLTTREGVVTLEPVESEAWRLQLAADGPRATANEAWRLTAAEGSYAMMREVLLAEFPVSTSGAGGPVAIGLLYRIDGGNPKYDLTTTFLTLCVVASARPLGPCQRVELAQTNFANELAPAGATYLYPPVEPAGRAPEPGRKSDVKILTFDVDDDGHRDLVIWRRGCRSMSVAERRARPIGRSLPDECDLDMLLERDELLWLRYEADAARFAAPVVTDRVLRPEREWWRKLVGLETIAFW